MESPAVDQSLQHWKPRFFTIWSGQAVSLLGSQLVQFALVWWLTQTTGSATVLATATLVALLPQVFLGPLAGVLVDRWSRRWLMILADSLIALATLGLAVLFWLGSIQVWQVYLLMFLRSALGAVHWSAMQASTSLMVPKPHLARIQGMNQMLSGLMNIGSAPLAALLLAALPMQAILSIDVITAMVAVIPLLLVAIPQPARAPAAEAGQNGASFWSELRAGFRYVWGWPGLLVIGVMATLINLLLTPTSSLQPILVTGHFKGQALQLAWLESAWGVGVVAGGITLSVWGGFKRRIVTSMLGLMLLGVAVLAVGLVPANRFWLAVALLFLIGFTNPIVNGPLLAAVQATVAPDMQGRVFTLINSFASAMTPLGLILAGPIADAYGVQVWYLAGGVVTLLMGVTGFMIPAVMHFEDRPPSAVQPAAGEASLAQAALEPVGD